MQSNIDLFQQLNTEILYIAQLERNPMLLPRIKGFVQHSFPVVCDPNQISRKPFPLFTAYIIDKQGMLRTRIPGSLSARPSLDMILEELCKVVGVARVHPHERGEVRAATGQQDPIVSAEEVLNVLWMWSHDRIAPGDQFKLAFLPTLANGFHVYAPQEERMTPLAIKFALPAGLAWVESLRYPAPDSNRDPLLEVDVLQYERDIPLPALVLQASSSMVPGTYTVTATVSYQACNDRLCYPPTEKTIAMPIEVVSKDTKRNQVSGWNRW